MMKTVDILLLKFFDQDYGRPIWRIQAQGIEIPLLCVNVDLRFYFPFEGKRVQAVLEVEVGEGKIPQSATQVFKVIKDRDSDDPSDGDSVMIVARYVGAIDEPGMGRYYELEFNGIPIYTSFELGGHQCPVAPGELVEVTGIMAFGEADT